MSPDREATEYRIDFTIQRRLPGGSDFEDVGYGSSGAWATVDQAAHMLHSTVQSRIWETAPGMPDPDELTAGGS